VRFVAISSNRFVVKGTPKNSLPAPKLDPPELDPWDRSLWGPELEAPHEGDAGPGQGVAILLESDLLSLPRALFNS
jgi:hypothetical protein